MENFYTTVQTPTGDVVNGATVTVYDASSGLPATIYEPDGVTLLANPFLSGYARDEGEIEFGAANGQYNIKIVNGAETDWIYRITLLDAAGALLGSLAYEDDASGVPIIDAGGLYAATEVDGALQEIATDLQAHITDPSGAHAASSTSIVDAGGYYIATDVEEALQEIPFLPPAYEYFTENRNISAPNATVPVHQWVVDGVETNIDITLSPKGTGAITAQVADGTATGGGKRGNYSVDLQSVRSASTQVASGLGAVIHGGRNNSSTGTDSGVLWGNGNTSGIQSGSGGFGCTASGNTSVSFGNENDSTGDYSSIYGGIRATTRGLYGRVSHASGYFATKGDAQIGHHVLRYSTTDATPTIITSDGSAILSTTNVPVLPDNHAYAITARVIGRDTATGDVYHVVAEGTAKRGVGAATTALDGTPAYTTISKSAGASTWAVALVANTTRGSAEIQVTGEAATTIHWVCKFDTVEVG